jgi:hypothetical protein
MRRLAQFTPKYGSPVLPASQEIRLPSRYHSYAGMSRKMHNNAQRERCTFQKIAAARGLGRSYGMYDRATWQVISSGPFGNL